jgi:mRNA interferase RelE/StbE
VRKTVANQRYRIEYAPSAIDDLRSLPKREADQILRKVLRLENGLQGNIKRLQNADVGFRLRMGDYRVLFDVIGDKILVQKIGNRKDVYE